MHNTISRWHYPHILESLLAPLQECESFLVADEFKFLILVLGIGGAGGIDLDGVIDYEVDLTQRVDFRWISSHLLTGCSHGRKIDDGWHTCEILEDDTCRHEWNLNHLGSVLLPVENGLDISLLNREFIAVPDC